MVPRGHRRRRRARSSTRGGRPRPARIMITTLPGAEAAKPGIAGTAAAGRRRARRRRGGQRRRAGRRRACSSSTRPWPSMLRTLYREDDRFVETYFSKLGKETYVVGDAARVDEDGYISIVGRIDDVINVSGPPHVDGRGRVGDRLAPAGRRGGGHRPERRGHRPGDRRVRDARGRPRRATTTSSATCASTSRRRSASSRGPSRSCGPTTCPRRARARSCAGCCATSPRGRELGDVTTLRDPSVVEQLKEQVEEKQKA